ncbi:ABC transporter ATP-binding protein [Thalassospira lucentensis]|uniref:ABC transporter ATP-binding protein n=1 Tax=Thalassospira lucentensis TaxID=168935 RepID=UPI003AA8D167
MAELDIKNIKKDYGNFRALDGINLSASSSELVALLGPSGCGKTTLLRSIAGFVPVTSGTIEIHGQDVTSLAPNRRNTGMVFQNYALFPHMTVEKNVAFGLEMRSTEPAELKKRVYQALELVSLVAHGNRYPKQLSGGQQQRVAVARALVVNPDVFLLDEPLSNLDAKLRQSVGMQLRNLQKDLGLTTVFVTHDQKEALMMADRLILMRAGKIVQEGSAKQLYASPATRFVADFLGLSNVFQGKAGQDHYVTNAGSYFKCDTSHAPSDCVLCLRPENIVMGAEADKCTNSFDAQIDSLTYLGASTEVTLRLPNGDQLTATHQNTTMQKIDLTSGNTIRIGFGTEACHLLIDDMKNAA